MPSRFRRGNGNDMYTNGECGNTGSPRRTLGGTISECENGNPATDRFGFLGWRMGP
jgi:hypothetical protein